MPSPPSNPSCTPILPYSFLVSKTGAFSVVRCTYIQCMAISPNLDRGVCIRTESEPETVELSPPLQIWTPYYAQGLQWLLCGSLVSGLDFSSSLLPVLLLLDHLQKMFQYITTFTQTHKHQMFRKSRPFLPLLSFCIGFITWHSHSFPTSWLYYYHWAISTPSCASPLLYSLCCLAVAQKTLANE